MMFSHKNKDKVLSKVTDKNPEEKMYLISLPQADGISHIIPLSQVTQETVSQTKQTKQISNERPKSNEINSSNIVYKIIKPADLNLKPNSTTYLPRGRPRKKVCVEKIPSTENEPKKVIKHARTRSGRITKPPKHIEVDFKKIDITEDSELKTVEFEPLKTNDSQIKQEPLLILEQHCKKRSIPPRYRCPSCNKAYLGKAKMLNHFEKHPDHGSIPSNVKNTATWDFLVVTAQKFKGSKVVKFCEELCTLLENAKKIAKYLFKAVHNDEQGYFINDQLANVFGIKKGNYSFDDTELSKDVSLYQYLETNISKKCNEQCEESTITQKDTAKIPLNNTETAQKANEVDLLNNHLTNQNSLALVKYEIPKLFNFSTPTFCTNDGNNSNYEDRNINMPSTKEEDNKCLEEKKEIFHHLQKEMTLQSELHDVDELMLENVVDTGQVNISEMSSNSDDIMNVDQFVNERFKKLTEPDMDIQSNSLNLELPPLDIFQFHTS